jgi:acyl-CoA synthetase (NDP forming)
MNSEQRRIAANALTNSFTKGHDIQRLDEFSTKGLLSVLGLNVPTAQNIFLDAPPVYTPGFQAKEYVIKAISADERLYHKQQAGGVRFFSSPDALVDACRALLRDVEHHIPGARVDSLLLEERIVLDSRRFPELIMTMRQDPHFGPLVYIGLGGSDTERLAKVMKTPLVAVSPNKLDLLGELVLGSAAGLAGFPLDEVKKVASVLFSLGSEFSYGSTAGYMINEIELNPVGLTPHGEAYVLDAKCTFEAHPLPPSYPISQTRDYDEGLRALMDPQSVAVIGASESVLKVGGSILSNLKLFLSGKPLYAVNNKGMTSVQGVDCFQAPEKLPQKVDLAVLALPAKHTPEAYRAIVANDRAKAVVIVSGGWSETQQGEQYEAALKQVALLAEKLPLTLGPNCWGVYSGPGHYDTFSPHHSWFKRPFRAFFRGPFADLSNSGQHAAEYFIRYPELSPVLVGSFGNMAIDDQAEVLLRLPDIPGLRFAAMYLEKLNPCRGNNLLSAIESLSLQGFPVLVQLSGRSEFGQEAALSHTAAMASDYETKRGLIEQHGGIVFSHNDDFFGTVYGLSLLSNPDKPALNLGQNVAGISVAGKLCTLTADMISEMGLPSFQFSEDLVGALRAVYPEKIAAIMNIRNPLDVGPDVNSETYLNICEVLLQAQEVHGLAVAMGSAAPQLGDAEHRLDQGLVKLHEKYRKPITVACEPGPSSSGIFSTLKEHGIPCFSDPKGSMLALGTYLKAFPKSK